MILFLASSLTGVTVVVVVLVVVVVVSFISLTLLFLSMTFTGVVIVVEVEVEVEVMMEVVVDSLVDMMLLRFVLVELRMCFEFVVQSCFVRSWKRINQSPSTIQRWYRGWINGFHPRQSMSLTEGEGLLLRVLLLCVGKVCIGR